jgi:hypothetical protein
MMGRHVRRRGSFDLVQAAVGDGCVVLLAG